MRIRLRDQSLLAELRQHFERSGFVVRELGTATIEATRPDAPNLEQGEREVEAHLAVWNVIHPDIAKPEPD